MLTFPQHSKNIVIHEGVAKITDFGNSKSLFTATNLHTEVFGMIPYVDPNLFRDISHIYNKKSDVYSIGVLMWEISSGRVPFSTVTNRGQLAAWIISGNREKPVPGTPQEYIDLYTLCWDGDSEKRPNIKVVLESIGNIEPPMKQDSSTTIQGRFIATLSEIFNIF